MPRTRRPSALNGFVGGSYCNPRTYWCGSDVGCIHRDRSLGYRLRAGK